MPVFPLTTSWPRTACAVVKEPKVWRSSWSIGRGQRTGGEGGRHRHVDRGHRHFAEGFRPSEPKFVDGVGITSFGRPFVPIS